ncbi:MAG: hypothetical protein CL949_14085 [Erythrobacter sp.]|nr:hypothetical protein [Erythrobacter sp.]
MTQHIIYHPGTDTFLPIGECSAVELPATVTEAEDIEAYIAEKRPVRRRRVEMDVAERAVAPINSLFLVRGWDVDGENQDLFVVAPTPARATSIWNAYCLDEDNEWSRSCNDNGDPQANIEPQNIRQILKDVSATEFDGPERAIDWPDLAEVL